MRAGFAQRQITPPVGCAMEGLGQVGGAQRIHDDLFLRVLALDHDGEEVLIVGMDVLFFERPIIDQYKGALGRRFDLTPRQILLNTTHNHAGPRMTRWAYSDGPDPDYLEQIQAALIDAAGEARAARQPVRLRAGTTTTDLPVSRRQVDANGIAQWAPWFSGPVCPALPFCAFENERGELVALLFSVSCHPSMIYFTEISAEYPGAAVRHLNQRLHTTGALFLQGMAGDTKPRPVADGEKRWRQGTWDELEQVGRDLADRVAAALPSAKPVTPALSALLQDVPWPLTPLPSDADYAAIRDNPQERAGRRAWATDMLHRKARFGTLPTSVPVALHSMLLGNGLRMIALEGEPVAELGTLMLGLFDQGVTFPLGYTNGCQLYLPVTRMLPEHGYEVDSFWEYHVPAPLAPGCEQPMVAALRDLQQQGRLPNAPLS